MAAVGSSSGTNLGTNLPAALAWLGHANPCLPARPATHPHPRRTQVAIKVLRWHMAETHSLREAYTQELTALVHLMGRRRQSCSGAGSNNRAAAVSLVGAAPAAAVDTPAAVPAAATPPPARAGALEGLAAAAAADLAPAGALGVEESGGSGFDTRSRAAGAGGGGGAGAAEDGFSQLHAHVLDFKGVVTRRDGAQALVLGRSVLLWVAGAAGGWTAGRAGARGRTCCLVVSIGEEKAGGGGKGERVVIP